jgi:hypothetical protein
MSSLLNNLPHTHRPKRHGPAADQSLQAQQLSAQQQANGLMLRLRCMGSPSAAHEITLIIDARSQMQKVRYLVQHADVAKLVLCPRCSCPRLSTPLIGND